MIDQKKIEQAAKEINPYTPGLHRTAFNEGFTAGVRFDESEIGKAQTFILNITGQCAAKLLLQNGELTLISAVDEYGLAVDPDQVIINKIEP